MNLTNTIQPESSSENLNSHTLESKTGISVIIIIIPTVVIVLIFLLIYIFCCRNRKKDTKKKSEETGPQKPFYVPDSLRKLNKDKSNINQNGISIELGKDYLDEEKMNKLKNAVINDQKEDRTDQKIIDNIEDEKYYIR
jgi:flagellar basal body-associated protein FliL